MGTRHQSLSSLTSSHQQAPAVSAWSPSQRTALTEVSSPGASSPGSPHEVPSEGAVTGPDGGAVLRGNATLDERSSMTHALLPSRSESPASGSDPHMERPGPLVPIPARTGFSAANVDSQIKVAAPQADSQKAGRSGDASRAVLRPMLQVPDAAQPHADNSGSYLSRQLSPAVTANSMPQPHCKETPAVMYAAISAGAQPLSPAMEPQMQHAGASFQQSTSLPAALNPLQECGRKGTRQHHNTCAASRAQPDEDGSLHLLTPQALSCSSDHAGDPSDEPLHVSRRSGMQPGVTADLRISSPCQSAASSITKLAEDTTLCVDCTGAGLASIPSSAPAAGHQGVHPEPQAPQHQEVASKRHPKQHSSSRKARPEMSVHRSPRHPHGPGTVVGTPNKRDVHQQTARDSASRHAATGSAFAEVLTSLSDDPSGPATADVESPWTQSNEHWQRGQRPEFLQPAGHLDNVSGRAAVDDLSRRAARKARLKVPVGGVSRALGDVGLLDRSKPGSSTASLTNTHPSRQHSGRKSVDQPRVETAATTCSMHSAHQEMGSICTDSIGLEPPPGLSSAGWSSIDPWASLQEGDVSRSIPAQAVDPSPAVQGADHTLLTDSSFSDTVGHSKSREKPVCAGCSRAGSARCASHRCRICCRAAHVGCDFHATNFHRTAAPQPAV